MIIKTIKETITKRFVKNDIERLRNKEIESDILASNISFSKNGTNFILNNLRGDKICDRTYWTDYKNIKEGRLEVQKHGETGLVYIVITKSVEETNSDEANTMYKVMTEHYEIINI